MAESGGSSGSGGHGHKSENTSFSLVGDYGCSDSDSADESHDFHAIDSQDVELSEMVLKNNIINACAHGPLPESSSDESSQIIIDSRGNGVIEYSVSEYRDQDSDDSVSSDSSSEINSVKDADEVDSSDDDSLDHEEAQTKIAPIKVRGELTLEELPPIEELAISVPETQTSPIGSVHNVVDKLVIVKAFPNTPAVDLDSVLFLDKGKRALGKVFDVFGPVSEPHYCVRFNSADEIRERDIRVGAEVFIAPDTDHTSFVFVSQLRQIKGSDASWLNDVEPPPSQLEYSDDEEERRARRGRRRGGGGDGERGEEQSSQREGTQREGPHVPTRFEEQMNRRNLQRSAARRNPAPRNPFALRPRARPPHYRPRPDPSLPFALARPVFGYPPPHPAFLPMPRQFFSPRSRFGFGQTMPWFGHNPPGPPNF